ncbi:MAG TPA: hypothetical protein DEP05_06140 [Betaproteobacteria bacterium]|nr:hypothetical protein [Betaproteobacteria bacterium]
MTACARPNACIQRTAKTQPLTVRENKRRPILGAAQLIGKTGRPAIHRHNRARDATREQRIRESNRIDD